MPCDVAFIDQFGKGLPYSWTRNIQQLTELRFGRQLVPGLKNPLLQQLHQLCLQLKI